MQLTEKIKNEIIKRLLNLSPKKIILFGSQATLNTHNDSDIDILVIVEFSDESRVKRTRKAFTLLRGLETPIDILVYTEEEINYWKETPLSFVSSALSEGKVIYEQAA